MPGKKPDLGEVLWRGADPTPDTSGEPLRFTDSLDGNMEVFRQLISNMPASAQQRAYKTAEKIRVVVEEIKRDAGRDPAAGLGLAWATHFIALEMTKDDRSLIQLLS